MQHTTITVYIKPYLSLINHCHTFFPFYINVPIFIQIPIGVPAEINLGGSRVFPES